MKSGIATKDDLQSASKKSKDTDPKKQKAAGHKSQTVTEEKKQKTNKKKYYRQLKFEESHNAMKKVNRKAVRDVSGIIQSLRDFLLGRKHNLHGRFPPYISPRSIPTPDVPRGPEYKYSDQYYYKRHYMDSSHPPVVAPVAEGPPVGHPKNKKVVPGGMKPDQLCFRCLPTPGTPWWWDGHCYYEFMEESPPQTSKFPPNVSKV